MKQLMTILVLTLLCIETAFAGTLAVGFSGTEVRSSASAMSSKVVFKAARYEPLTVLEEGKEYVKVSNFRGRTGWVHKSLLKEMPSVVITGDRINLREGAGTNHAVVGQLSRGEGAKLLSKTEGWVELQTTGGQVGWAADFLVWGE